MDEMMKVAMAFVIGLIVGFGLAYVSLPKPQQVTTTFEQKSTLDTGIVKEGYYSSLEDAARDLDVSIYFKPCKDDPNTAYTAMVEEGKYYRLAYCTATDKGYYCAKIESDHPTPNFIYWYSKCVGTG